MYNKRHIMDRIIKNNNLKSSLFPDTLEKYLQNINIKVNGLKYIEEMFKDDDYLLKIQNYKIMHNYGISDELPEMKRFILELCNSSIRNVEIVESSMVYSGGLGVSIHKNYLIVNFYGENFKISNLKESEPIFKKKLTKKNFRNKKLNRINGYI